MNFNIKFIEGCKPQYYLDILQDLFDGKINYDNLIADKYSAQLDTSIAYILHFIKEAERKNLLIHVDDAVMD